MRFTLKDFSIETLNQQQQNYVDVNVKCLIEFWTNSVEDQRETLQFNFSLNSEPINEVKNKIVNSTLILLFYHFHL